MSVDFHKFGIESPLTLVRFNRMKPNGSPQKAVDHTKAYFIVLFENKDDLSALAHSILFEKLIKVNTKKLHLKLHTKRGNYNS